MPRNADLNAVNRQWELLKCLPTKAPGKTSRQLMEMLNDAGYPVTKRTVERDLQDLTLPFPIQCNDKSKPYGWYWTPGSSAELPGITLAEALSIKLVEDLVKPLLPQSILTSFQAHFNQARNKLAALHENNAAARWQDKVRYVSPALSMLPPHIEEPVLENVQQALLHDRQIEVKYRTVHSDQIKQQTLHPLGLVQRGPITYLVATAFQYQDIRLYAVHRFVDVTITEEPVKRPDDFDLDRYIASGALQFGNGEALALKAWVSKDLADYLTETRLSADQVLTPEGEGYLLTTTVNDTWQLRWWILGQANAINVLEPEALREELIAGLRTALSRYEVSIAESDQE
ncbi:MAG: WYL domain-containing protein [Methylomonas sp.]|nr:WYL domain-containing protein [Methylomonas sp.]